MNKTVTLLLAWLWAGVAFAQKNAPAPLPLDQSTQHITYTAVVAVAGTSQADLLARAKVWAAGVATPDKPPTTSNDQGTDVVTVLGSQQMMQKIGSLTLAPFVHFSATVSLREGRYQYRLSDFVLYYGPAAQQPMEAPLIAMPAAGKGNKKYLADLRKSFDEAITAALARLQDTMSKPPAPAGKEW